MHPAIGLTMPTDFTVTLSPFLWVAVGFAFAAALTMAVARHTFRRKLEAHRAQADETLAKLAAAEHARQELAQAVASLEHGLASERETATALSFRLEQLSAASDNPSAATQERENESRQLEASEQALKQAKLLVHRRQVEISKLASQVDDLALNLEETRILVAEKEREALDTAKREQQAEDQLAQLLESEATLRHQLEQAEAQLKNQGEAQSRTGQALAQAQGAIHQWESMAGELQEQQATLSQQLSERQTAYATLERMLQDATATDVQLRRDLKSMSFDRQQLEIQNIELKNVLSQMYGGAAIEATSTRASSAPSLESWPAVSESDIQSAVIDLRPLPSIPVEPYGAVTEVQGNVRELPANRGLDREAAVLERELREARVRLQLLESGMGDLEYLREQNAKLRDELLQDRGAARELTTLQLEHKRLKLDLQLAEQRLATQSERLEDLSNVASELKDHKEELETLHHLRTQLRDAKAENFALINASSGTYPIADAVVPLQSDAHELAPAPLDTAVLSDHLGLPVAATGSLPAESLAAVSGIAVQGASYVRELLPLGPISTVQWVDLYGMTVTCKLFNLAGVEMAMTTLAPGNPSEQALKQTLRTVLASIGWNEDGPQTDVDNSAVG